MKSATDYLLQVAKKSETVINLIAGYSTDAIEDFFLDKIYHNLSLKGSESLFRTFRELWKFQRFIQLVELDRKDYETHKIALTKGQNVFTCSMVNRKSLCKFINWMKVMVSIKTSFRLSRNGTSISRFSSQSKRILQPGTFASGNLQHDHFKIEFVFEQSMKFGLSTAIILIKVKLFLDFGGCRF